MRTGTKLWRGLNPEWLTPEWVLVLVLVVLAVVLVAVSYTHLRAHETLMNLVCRLLLEKKIQENPENPIWRGLNPEWLTPEWVLVLVLVVLVLVLVVLAVVSS